MSGLIARAQEWLFSVALKKAAARVAVAAAAYLAGHLAPQLADKVGISVSVDPDVLAAGILAGLEVVRNWLKFRLRGGAA